MTSKWTVDELKKWDDIICKKAESYGLDWYPISYEICDYYEMIGHMSYHGMPSHYNHWSYGKQFERTHFMYNQGMEGLPYELIINSDPSIAYLMRENPLYLQILIMAHCVGHSDFFKNNRCFKNTGAKHIVSKLRNAKKRIQKYSEDTNIGVKKVEQLLDALHSISFQTSRYDIPRKTRKEIYNSEIQRYNKLKDEGISLDYKQLDKRLLRPDYDLLSFFLEYYPDKFNTWETDIIEVVRTQSQYFIPQIKTKILNEGWASFWHYKILHELNLGDNHHLPFLKMHNAVVRPHIGGLNPYHIGFYLFQKMERTEGLEKCFEIREVHDDISALRLYLDEEDYRELNLFSYERKKNGDIIISEVADHDDWSTVRDDFLKSVGINAIPQIYVDRVEKDETLVLKHEHDGRDIDLQHANKVVKHIKDIWKKHVKLYTIIEDEIWEI